MKNYYLQHSTGMTTDHEFEELASALRAEGLLNSDGKRLHCLIKRADGSLTEGEFLHLWDDPEDAREFAKRVHLSQPGRRWSVFEVDLIPLYEILDLRNLKLPERPKVLDVRSELFLSSIGSDALRVWVILDDDTSTEDRSWKMLMPIENAIHDAIHAAMPLYGVELSPYFWYRTAAEFAEEQALAS